MLFLLAPPEWTAMNLEDWLIAECEAGAQALASAQALVRRQPQICWYPSAGNCFRDLVAWEHPNLLDVPSPSLFIHTDYKGQWVDANTQSLDDGQASIEERFPLKLKYKIDYQVSSDHASHAGLSFETPQIELLLMRVKTAKDWAQKPVLYFYFENINWFETFVLNKGLRLTHLYKKDEGLNGGGCRTSVCNLYPYLESIGCHHMLTDQELSIEARVIDRLLARYHDTHLTPLRVNEMRHMRSGDQPMAYLGLDVDFDFYEIGEEEGLIDKTELSGQPRWIRQLFSELQQLEKLSDSHPRLTH